MKRLKAKSLCQLIRQQNLAALSQLDIDPATLDDCQGVCSASPRQWAHWVGHPGIKQLLGIHQNADMNVRSIEGTEHIYNDALIQKNFSFHYTQQAIFENPNAIHKVIVYLRWLFKLSYFKNTCRWYDACYRDDIAQPRHVNSVVQYINEDVGYGLFANCPMEPGDFIGEYTGVINLRHLLSPLRDTTYIMAYPIPMPPGLRWSIDAREYGNFTRFINHADSANSHVCVAYDGFTFRMLIIATDAIASGEEITLDYGEDYWYQRKLRQAQSDSNTRT